jgi:hypothetical protein
VGRCDAPPSTRYHLGGRLTMWGFPAGSALGTGRQGSMALPGVDHGVALRDMGARVPRGCTEQAPYILQLEPPEQGPLVLLALVSQEATVQQQRLWEPVHPGAITTHMHTQIQSPICPSAHPYQAWARARCTPAAAGWAGVYSHIDGGLACGTGSPSRPRAPTAGWGRGQQVMGEHRVVPRGAGAGGVLATG